MEILILYDNQAKKGFQSGWGFSCLVDGRILFDTGESWEALQANMRRFGIGPETIESVVISHNHWDHTGGLWGLLEVRRNLPVCVCSGFGTDFFEKTESLSGRIVEAESFNTMYQNVKVTGQVDGFYRNAPMPEQALLVCTPDGLHLIAGCSHPGILRMAEKARPIDPERPLVSVWGGFHMKEMDERSIRATIFGLKVSGIRRVGPTHCTGETAKKIFRKIFGPDFVRLAAGTRIEL
ncbi:MAG TPA: MBL fold metallo-hydrolase [bacterium]|nr:MBL fold metallo-hydrolase [bacterium]